MARIRRSAITRILALYFSIMLVKKHHAHRIHLIATSTISFLVAAIFSAVPSLEYTEVPLTTQVEEGGISVSMVLDEPIAVGQSVPLEQLDLTARQRADVRARRAPVQSMRSGAAGGYDVVSRWRDKDKRAVYLRRQAREKIVNKHNLTTAVVKKVTKSATWKGRAPGASKTKYNYNLNFGRFICYPNRCILKEEVMVLTVVDFRSLGRGKGSYGVVTAYCETGHTRCPDYVKKSFNL